MTQSHLIRSLFFAPANRPDLITKFPRFYVTGWGGNGSNDDPCPDDDPAEPGEIVGYFITFGEPGGPVDQTSSCIPGDLTPCRAVLVR